jgi:hypothetical protein
VKSAYHKKVKRRKTRFHPKKQKLQIGSEKFRSEG